MFRNGAPLFGGQGRCVTKAAELAGGPPAPCRTGQPIATDTAGFSRKNNAMRVDRGDPGPSGNRAGPAVGQSVQTSPLTRVLARPIRFRHCHHGNAMAQTLHWTVNARWWKCALCSETVVFRPRVSRKRKTLVTSCKQPAPCRAAVLPHRHQALVTAAGLRGGPDASHTPKLTGSDE